MLVLVGSFLIGAKLTASGPEIRAANREGDFEISTKCLILSLLSVRAVYVLSSLQLGDYGENPYLLNAKGVAS
jgi:hypothetical protein